MASWARETFRTTLWIGPGLLAVAIAGAVTFYAMAAFAFSLGMGPCGRPVGQYIESLAIGLAAAVIAHLPGLLVLRHRLQDVAGPVARFVPWLPIGFCAAAVLTNAGAITVFCVGERTTFQKQVVQMTELGPPLAVLLLLLCVFTAAVLGVSRE